MKIKSVLAVGALSAGLGIAGFIGAGTASAVDCSTLPVGQGRIACLAAEQTNTFLTTASPQYNLDILLNGTTTDECDENGCVPVNDGLGLDITKPDNQLKTFQKSLQDFANGPVSP